MRKSIKTEDHTFFSHCEKTFLKTVDLGKLLEGCKNGCGSCKCATGTPLKSPIHAHVVPLEVILSSSNDSCLCCCHSKCTCSKPSATTAITPAISTASPPSNMIAACEESEYIQTQRDSEVSFKVQPSPGRQHRPAAIFTLEKDGFHICMDVKQFRYDELSVRIVDDMIYIEAKHDEREDDNIGFVTRSIMRRYQIPQESDPDEVLAELSADKILTIKAPLRREFNKPEKIIPIRELGDEAACQTCPCMKEEDGKPQ